MNDWQPSPAQPAPERWTATAGPGSGGGQGGATLPGSSPGSPGAGSADPGLGAFGDRSRPARQDAAAGRCTAAGCGTAPGPAPGPAQAAAARTTATRRRTRQPTGTAQPAGPAPRRFLSRGGGDTKKGKGQKKHLSFWKELPILILIAFVLALLIKAFFVQAFYIPSGSMEQTLLIGDRVLVNKIVYDFRDVHRGEVVVFNGDGTNFQQAEVAVPPPSNFFERILRDIQGFLGLGAPNEKDFIKRVIGVGGDTVSCCDAAGRVIVNGKALDEPYVYYGDQVPTPNQREFAPVQVPKGYLFVMGDHRNSSTDSRMVGPIPEDNVIGRAQIRIWPVSRLAWLRVPPTFDTVPNPPGALGEGSDGSPNVGDHHAPRRPGGAAAAVRAPRPATAAASARSLIPRRSAARPWPAGAARANVLPPGRFRHMVRSTIRSLPHPSE